jgi:hypothetical protein
MSDPMVLGDAFVIAGLVLGIIATACVDRAGRWLRASGFSPPVRPLASFGRTIALLREYRAARVRAGRTARMVHLFWLTFGASLVCMTVAFWLILR